MFLYIIHTSIITYLELNVNNVLSLTTPLICVIIGGKIVGKEAATIQIWITWCRRQATCRYCELPIEVGNPLVRGQSRQKAAEWKVKLFWHPECWLKDGLQYLEQHPYSAKSQGRPKLQLDEDSKAARKKLITRRAQILYNIREQLENGETELSESLLVEVSKIVQFYREIEVLGGAPKSWQKPLTEIIPQLAVLVKAIDGQS